MVKPGLEFIGGGSSLAERSLNIALSYASSLTSKVHLAGDFNRDAPNRIQAAAEISWSQTHAEPGSAPISCCLTRGVGAFVGDLFFNQVGLVNQFLLG